MGHNKKDCLERPRKIAAKFMNKQLAADDFVQPTLVQTYDGKRDRWAGYDPSQHKAIVEQYQRIEEAKRALKAERLNKSVADNEVSVVVIHNELSVNVARTSKIWWMFLVSLFSVFVGFNSSIVCSS